MSIAARIRKARLKAGISQARLAELLGVTRSACSQWESENGTAPRSQRLVQIASLLSVNYEWLVTGRGNARSGSELAETAEVYAPSLTPDQEELLTNYNKLSAKARIALLELLRALPD